jgi:hypothetical protein
VSVPHSGALRAPGARCWPTDLLSGSGKCLDHIEKQGEDAQNSQAVSVPADKAKVGHWVPGGTQQRPAQCLTGPYTGPSGFMDVCLVAAGGSGHTWAQDIQVGTRKWLETEARKEHPEEMVGSDAAVTTATARQAWGAGIVP